MLQLLLSSDLMIVSAVAIAALTLAANSRGPAIHIEDVERFYQVYDASGGHPSADQLQHEYLDRGSAGLHVFARLRNITGVRISETLEKHPQLYSGARRCMVVLPRVRQRLAVALRQLRRIYPTARFPPVTIAVSRGKPMGVGSPVTGVQIGLESLCAAEWANPSVEDRFVHVIAHEYAHVQQVRALVDDVHPTVLEASLVEGAAELIAELISGDVGYTQFRDSTRGHEAEIERAFVADEDKTDLSQWLYNGTLEKPGDLGYWVGYRIVRSYYERSPDKKRAVREIMGMTDPHAFLARSGWSAGSSY